MLRMPTLPDPRPNYRVEMEDADPEATAATKRRIPQAITDRVLRRRAQFAKSQAAKDPSQRPDRMADLIEVQAASGLSEVAVYSCDTESPSLYVAYDCPRNSYFDNVNEQEAQRLMLQAQEAMRLLRQSRIYARASAVYHISDPRCPMAGQAAERMSRLYNDKPGGVMVV